MSAVWQTPWQLLGVGLRNAPPKQATLSTASQLFQKASRIISIHRTQFRLFSGEQNRFAEKDLGIKFWDKPYQNFRATVQHTRQASFSTSSQLWKTSSSSRVKPPARASKPAAADLSNADIKAIFGGSLDRQKGNQVLRTLQNQRVSGTLDQDVEASPIDVVKGLTWLRINIPVNEDAAIIARLEKEEIEFERSLREYSPQQSSQTRDIYGESALQKIREINKRKYEEREEEEKKRKEERKPMFDTSPSKAVVERRARVTKWVESYKDQATRKGKFITEMTRFERLWPSTAVAISVIAISVLFAHFYIPPPQKARIWPDVPPAAATVVTLIGLNVLVFLAWRIPPAWKFMNSHFIMTAAQPFSSSIIGSIFSHHTFSHLARNMLVLWFIGIRLHDDIGRGQFLAVYFSVGVGASLGSLSSYVLRNLLHTSSLGASGAICGLVACWALIHADDTLVLPFMPRESTQWISLPALLTLFIIHDLIGLRRGQFGPAGWAKVDYASHLAGYAVGIGAGQILRWRAKRRRQENLALKKSIEL